MDSGTAILGLPGGNYPYRWRGSGHLSNQGAFGGDTVGRVISSVACATAHTRERDGGREQVGRADRRQAHCESIRLQPARSQLLLGRWQGLPDLARRVSHTCGGLRPRRARRMHTFSRPPVLPSITMNSVGTLIFDDFAAQYPACMSPCQRFAPSLQLTTHDSGPVWLARPSPYGSFIHTSTPVYPGALYRRSEFDAYGCSINAESYIIIQAREASCVASLRR